MEWYNEPHNLELLGRYMMEEHGCTLPQFLDILDKAYNWEEQYRAAVVWEETNIDLKVDILR